MSLDPQDRSGPYATGRMVTHRVVEPSGELLKHLEEEPIREVRIWRHGFIVGALSMGVACSLGFLAYVLLVAR